MRYQKIKLGIIFFLTLTLFLNLDITHAETNQSEEENQTYPSYSALIFLGNGYGWNYYDIREVLDSWNWSITTAGISQSVSGCPNRKSMTEDCNLTISQISNSDLKNYDCLIIPSGGHWESLSRSTVVQDLIRAAYNRGLVIMTICIGQAVIASAHKVIRGKDVAMFSGSSTAVLEAGGKLVTEPVVTDGRIVTGGKGGGRGGGGYTRAPTNETCIAMREAIFDYNARIRRITIGSAIGVPIILTGLGFVFYLLKTHKISFKKNK